MHARGEFERSFVVFQQALALSREEARPDRQAKCLLRLGILRWDLGEIVASKSRFEEAAALFDKTCDAKSSELCRQCIALVLLYDQGRADRASRLPYRSADRFAQALALAREIGIADLQLKCLRQAALTDLELGDLDRFLEKSQAGVAIAAMIPHRLEQGRFLNNIGLYYQQRIDYARAVEHLEQALPLFRALGERAAEAECLNDLGLVYRELGNFDRAQFLLSKALELDKTRNDTYALAVDLENIGSVLLRRGLDLKDRQDLMRALDAFEASLRIQETELMDPLISFTALNNAGIILAELDDFPGAQQRFAQALKTVKTGNHDLERSHALVNIGICAFGEGKVEEALVSFRSAHEISLREGYEHILFNSSSGLGQCLEHMGDPESALSFYMEAIGALEGMKARLPEPLLISFARNKFMPYERAVGILANRHERPPSEEACAAIFDLIERAKARAFLQNLREARVDLSGADLQRLLDRQRALAENIAALSRRVSSVATPDGEKVALRREIEREEEESVRLASEIKAPDPLRAHAWGQEIRRLGDTKYRLAESDAVMLDYFLGEPNSFLLAVSPASVQLHRLPGQRDLEQSLRAYLKSLSDPSLDPGAGILAAARISRQILPDSVDQLLQTAKALVILPDGILHALPFEALRIAGPNGGRYLLEGPAISYAPSASSLAVLESRERPKNWAKQILAVGSPYPVPLPPSGSAALPRLPFSTRELYEICRPFPVGATDILAGKDANEGRVKTLCLSDYRLIHFACHGFVDEVAPLRSALVLSADSNQDEDGLLQIREIYGLRLSAELVVLSACRTGAGRLERSEGALALARPFFFAGARAVIASLWPVGDRSTVPLMGGLYKLLGEGRPVAEALRESKLRLLRSRWSHPFYWAAFLLQGDPSASGFSGPTSRLP